MWAEHKSAGHPGAAQPTGRFFPHQLIEQKCYLANPAEKQPCETKETVFFFPTRFQFLMLPSDLRLTLFSAALPDQKSESLPVLPVRARL